MVLHPEVLRKGQEEIDRVVGTDRLPNFDDRANLPYVEAIFLECLRFVCLVLYSIPPGTKYDCNQLATSGATGRTSRDVCR